jgi:hypothetical protein
VSSDERIKTNIKPTFDSLDTINKINVRSYDYVDKTMGGVKHGIIAQEINEVYPECVTRGIGTIPSIMELSESIESTASTLTITLLHNHALTTNDTVVLYSKSSEYKQPVLAIPSLSSFTVANPWSQQNDDIPSSIFVYGKQVDDFMGINKSLLAVLAVGACKTLSQQISSLQEDNKAIQSTLYALQTISK